MEPVARVLPRDVGVRGRVVAVVELPWPFSLSITPSSDISWHFML